MTTIFYVDVGIGRIIFDHLQRISKHPLWYIAALSLLLLAIAASLLTNAWYLQMQARHRWQTTTSVNQAFELASGEFGVPVPVLKAVCYMEGRLSNRGGSPSVDQGYGCMNLVKNERADTLDQAAKDLGISSDQLRINIIANIRGGAAVLHDEAIQSSPEHTLPTSLADWYSTLAAYSHARMQSVARLYADALYRLLQHGFRATAETGEVVILAPQRVQPNIRTNGLATATDPAATTISSSSPNALSSINTSFTPKATISPTQMPPQFPKGCNAEQKTDYPGAINCIVSPPSVYDCNRLPDNAPCTYESAHRPSDIPINFVVIHDIEGTALSALSTFQNMKNSVSIHYIVDSDGTIYQMLHEQDIGYHAGNYWYNQRTIGIEHTGFSAAGFQWYNAAEYLASAQLVAYLLKKYNIPLDHDHIMGHGTIPAPALKYTPNHTDPGPYWLWDYYLDLIHKQGIPVDRDNHDPHVIALHPASDQYPAGQIGEETPDNFSYFPLFTAPNTRSARIPQAGSDTESTNETTTIEPAMSYYYLEKTIDPAGTGNIMYKIWYGEETQVHSSTLRSFFAHARLAWLAAPPGAAIPAGGTPVALNPDPTGVVKIYGKPLISDPTSATSSGSSVKPQPPDFYQIGDGPAGAVFVSVLTVKDPKTSALWYAINYNHRQAWVRASNVTLLHATPAS